jgi:hypothetical protein
MRSGHKSGCLVEGGRHDRRVPQGPASRPRGPSDPDDLEEARRALASDFEAEHGEDVAVDGTEYDYRQHAVLLRALDALARERAVSEGAAMRVYDGEQHLITVGIDESDALKDLRERLAEAVRIGLSLEARERRVRAACATISAESDRDQRDFAAAVAADEILTLLDGKVTP